MADEKKNADAMGELMGRLWSRSREEMGRAAKRGREMLALRQLRTDRDRMYQKLGREAMRLVEGGEIDHPGIVKGVTRVKAVEEKIRETEETMRATGQEPEPESGG